MLVDSDRLLRDLKERVLAEKYCAMDVEFMRRNTYAPDLSLLMLSVNGYDPILDTQIAAAFCGMPFMIGFMGLVENCLGITLNKKMRQSNWHKRPLTPAQITYAENEVHYLLDAFHVLREKLEASGRMAWVKEECAALTVDFEKNLLESRCSVTRIRGAGRLNRRDLSILHLLAQWREKFAAKLNRPSRWVIPDEDLLNIAEKKPNTMDALKRASSLNDTQVETCFSAIRDCIDEGLSLDESELHADINVGRPSAEEKNLLNSVRNKIEAIAKEQDLAKEVIATRADISDLIRDRDYENSPLMKGWRAELIKEPLLSILEPGGS